MHGSVHSNSESLNDHPNGRCAMGPVVKPLPGLAPPTLPETGPAQFARLTPTQQDSILGQAAGKAYRAGVFKLEDVVGRTFDPDWGPGFRVKSLRELVGPEEAGKWYNKGKVDVPAPIKAPVLPVGQKISETFDLSGLPGAKSAIRPSIDRALQAIDKVHGVPDTAPKIPIKETRGKNRVGAYTTGKYTGKPIDIGVSKNGDTPVLTLTHEIGHYLDHQVISTPRRFASHNSPLLDDWSAAAANSQAVADLNKTLRSGKVLTSNGFVMDADIGWLGYALQKEEVFARAYAQYIAETSGDTVMLGEIAGLRAGAYPGEQWDTADFAPIRKAFDELFAKLGWRK